MSKLIINLRGGTGNQLFQAAAAASLACICKKNCQFSIDKLSKDQYKRKLEINTLLDNLGIKENKAKKDKSIIYLDQYDIDHPLYFSKNSPLASLTNDIQLEGYFTNYRIHNPEIKEIIKTSIKKLEINQKYKKLEFMAIHLRELHGNSHSMIMKKIDNIKINYYFEAINLIIKNPNFSGIKHAVVFCDTWKNPESSKLLPQVKVLLKNFGINYINGDKEIKSPLDIINIFSLSKCSIISNSTLSWWGAYLSNGKIFSPVMNLWEPDLKIPDHWEQIYSGEIEPKTHHNKSFFQAFIKSKKDIKYSNYNTQRILIIKIFRKLSNKIMSTKLFKILKKWMTYIGLFQENPNKTFF